MLAASVLLGGCTPAHVAEPIQLPPLAQYTPEFLARAADEVRALPRACARDAPSADCSTLLQLVIDYMQLRGQLRILDGGKHDGADDL